MTALLILVAALVVAIAAYGFACDVRRLLDSWLWRRDERAALARLRETYAHPEAEQLERLWQLPCAPNPRRLV